MTSLLKKFSDFLGISDPEYIKAPPLDGEIIYCKNNVCVHPPPTLTKRAEHHPGYLTLRSQGNSRATTSLILTWIPNSSLDRHRRASPVDSAGASPVGVRGDEGSLDRRGVSHREEGAVTRTGDADDGVLSQEAESNRGVSESRRDPGVDASGDVRHSSPGRGTVIREAGGEISKSASASSSPDGEGNLGRGAAEVDSPGSGSPRRHRRASLGSRSSESDAGVPTDAQLAILLADDGKPVLLPESLQRPRDLMVGPANHSDGGNKVREESLSSASSDPSSLPSPLRTMMREQMIRDLREASERADSGDDHGSSSVSSSTTPTTSNPDPGSLPSSPGSESFDPFLPLYNRNTPPSLTSPASPYVSHNLTFPENSIVFSSAGSRSPHATPKEQLCGVFSVDLSHMRSLRVFFSGEKSASGQLVIASQESQYKILHFHHGGLDRLTKVFDHWKCCIKQKSKSKFPDKEDIEHLYHKFTVLQSRIRPSDCHPEEGVYDEVNEEMWWSYLNEKGQVEDNYELRKAIFFGGIDEYLRRDIWPFLLHYFAFDSTLEDRNALRGIRREEYAAIQQARLDLDEDEKEEFFRNVKCTVDKDVVRTDRSHPYFKGDDNPNVDIMRNILLNFAMYKPGLGYTQGMSDLLAPVLAELQDEADAFWCLVGLMGDVIFVSSPKDDDMEKQLGYVRALIKLLLPDFWNHLLTLQDAMELLFCHRWILLCFKREFSESEALKMWEACWAHYQTDYFHLFICLAIIAIYGEDVVQQKLPSDDMLLHFSNLSMQMNGELILKKARGLLHQFRLLPRIPCTLDRLCETCTPGMWDSGHTPEVECVGLGVHGQGYLCPHIR